MQFEYGVGVGLGGRSPEWLIRSGAAVLRGWREAMPVVIGGQEPGLNDEVSGNAIGDRTPRGRMRASGE